MSKNTAVISLSSCNCDHGLRPLRSALAAGVAALMVLALSAPAEAARHSARSAPAKTGKKDPPKLPFDGQAKAATLQIVVSIGSQHLSLYANGKQIGSATVSTGMASKPTPTGVFSVIQKDRYHHSNLYGNAPMYYMHRITWSGVAMHEGVNPGVPASHGCIRLPTGFVSNLWQVSNLGLRVIVARSDVVPRDVEHPSLFQPKEKPADSPSAALGGPRATLASTNSAQSRPLQLAQAAPAADGKITDAATGATIAAPDNTNVDVPPPPPIAPTIETVPEVESTATIKAEGKKPEGAPPPALAADPNAIDPGKPLGLRLSGSEPDKPATDTVDPPKPQVPRSRGVADPVKHNGHVAVFVSRKEKKLFVRQGFVPLFDMPIEIDNPDQPLGTHVFTALALRENGETMRWNLMSMPGDQGRTVERERGSDRRKGGRKAEPVKPAVETRPPSTAIQALERIHFPKEVVERIDEILVPGSSLVISDQGLGGETGRGTDFIVLTR